MQVQTQFAAVQLRDETAHQAIGHFMTTAHKMGLKFKTLETYGVFSVGTLQFVRFRTDCWNLSELAQQLRVEGRGTITQEKDAYAIELPNGRKGRVNVMTMQASPLPAQQQTYRGPKIKYWDRQFAA